MNNALFTTRLLVLFMVCILLTGCPKVNGTRNESSTNGLDSSITAPKAGFIYFLPFRQYDLEVTYRVTKCANEPSSAPAGIAVLVKTQGRTVPDTSTPYAIDFDQLESFWKSTDFVVEFHENGYLKSINADSQDRVAGFVGSIAATAASILHPSLGIQAQPSAAVEQPPRQGWICNEKTQNALEQTRSGKPQVERLSREVEQLTESISRYTDAYAATGVQGPPGAYGELAALVKELTETRLELLVARRALEDALAQLSIFDKVEWPGQAGSAQSEISALTLEEAAERWFKAPEFDESDYYVKVQARLIADESLNTADPSAESHTSLYYRRAVPGTLEVCAAHSTMAGMGNCETVFTHKDLIPQLGPVHRLDLKGRAFRDRTVEMQFSDDGAPVRIGTKTTAAAEGVGSMLETLAAKQAEVRQAGETQELREIQAETELLKAKAELEAARAALMPADPEQSGEETETYRADAALNTARLVDHRAQQVLTKADSMDVN